MAAIWTATLLIFAYVDLFALYRADVRADLDQGRMAAFDIGQPFLFFTTLYVVIPSALVYLTLVMPHRLNRIVNIVAAGFYAVTAIASAVGEWGYYVLGTVVEVLLLAALIRHAWTWSDVTRACLLNPGGRVADDRRCASCGCGL